MKCYLFQLFFILYVTGKRCPYLKLSFIETKIQVDQSVGKYSFQSFSSKDQPQSHLQPDHPLHGCLPVIYFEFDQVTGCVCIDRIGVH